MAVPIVEVAEAVKTFRGGVRALDSLSLTVPAGMIFGLLGPNGAGKTTLIRVLATLLALDAGVVRVAGVDVRRDPAAARGVIGLAGQYASVDDYLTGAENVAMVGRLYGLGRRTARARTDEVLDRIGLRDAAGRQVRTYSGGMRRRLDLAACLVGRPRVLLLDEPTTGVDPASRREVWTLVRGLVADGTTVLLTTQDLAEADELAARIAVIDHGRVIAAGTNGELKSRVGGAVVELEVADSDHATAVTALPPGRSHQVGDRGRLVVPAEHGADTLRAVLHSLAAAGIDPVEIALRRPTLDEVFLALTGHTTAHRRRAA